MSFGFFAVAASAVVMIISGAGCPFCYCVPGLIVGFCCCCFAGRVSLRHCREVKKSMDFHKLENCYAFRGRKSIFCLG